MTTGRSAGRGLEGLRTSAAAVRLRGLGRRPRVDGETPPAAPAPPVPPQLDLPTAGNEVAPAPAELSSAELVRLAQSGQAQAYGLLYDRYLGMVYRYVCFRVADRQLAEDLTSETFLRGLRSISGFSDQGRDVGAWFVTIARNLVADHYRSGRYRLELTTADVTVLARVPVQEGPERAVLARLETTALLDAVRRLTPEQQECVALRFLQGLSVAETAQVMARNDAAIKALQYRAVRTLERLLTDQATAAKDR